MNHTTIEWTHRPETANGAGGFTWNPIRARLKNFTPLRDSSGNLVTRSGTGTFCTRISPGCQHCYASVINKRFGTGLEYTVPNLEKHEFFIDERILEEPLRRKKPATIFVGDMFDLFHEVIPKELIFQVYIVMATATWHTFQVLTKRAARMQEIVGHTDAAPFQNIWHGVSVEDRTRAWERIPRLQETPSVVRFLSIEPQLEEIPTGFDTPELGWVSWLYPLEGVDPIVPRIDWVICGGESGPGARPMHPNWARSLRDQCAAAKVPFFFKQWGEWQPHPDPPDRNGSYHGGIFLLSNGRLGNQGDWWDGRAHAMDRVGKKHAGALLDGREWREFPALKSAEVPA